MDETTTPQKNIERGSRFNNKKLGVIGLVILVQIALIAAVFTLAYTLGKDVGRTEATVEQGLNGVGTLLSSVSNPNQSTSGKVVEVSAKQITVENQRGVKKTVGITSKTEITRKAEPADTNDIKPGNTVSIFFVTDAQELTADKIIISRQ